MIEMPVAMIAIISISASTTCSKLLRNLKLLTINVKELTQFIRLQLYTNRGDQMSTWRRLKLKNVTWLSLLAFCLL